MNSKNPLKWRHFKKEIILLNVRWYLRYPLSYRDLEEMMLERNLEVDHTTIFCWVQAYSPEIEKRFKPHVIKTNDSWTTDETYIKIRGKWEYLYRAVDLRGNTIDFLLRAKRGKAAAKRFCQKALKASHNVTARVITVDKNAAYPPAIQQIKDDKIMADA
ncbi:MAG: IS6 family transposase [Desulfobacteraceae bacterium]|nr:IS6 family transposase [Desulfobacteraceae bacterium]